MKSLLHRFAKWLSRKTMPYSGSRGTGYVDNYRRQGEPTPAELQAQLKGTAWTCASLNAAVCASNPPKLYVTTKSGDARPKCLTKSVRRERLEYLMKSPQFANHTRQATIIEEVETHPVLDLLAQVNPIHNSFDLWELTTLYQEVHGSAYWKLELNDFGLPAEVWILPSQNTKPVRYENSPNAVDAYCYLDGANKQYFPADEVIHFRYPDPRDPYCSGLSPLRASFEQVLNQSDYAALKGAKLANRAIPDAIVTPAEVIGEEERDRFEQQWRQKFGRGGNGGVVVGESSMKVEMLNQSMGDLAALAEAGATKEDIANAFHVPISFLTANVNVANLQAANQQHMSHAILPRLLRRDQKLNEQLIPLYDPSGRLFLASDDPVPLNWDVSAREKEINLKYGVNTINEIRREMGLPPVPWGEKPWLPLSVKPIDNHVAAQTIITDNQ